MKQEIHLGYFATFGKDLNEGVSCRKFRMNQGTKRQQISELIEGRVCIHFEGFIPTTHSSTVGERLPTKSRFGSRGPVREVDVEAEDMV